MPASHDTPESVMGKAMNFSNSTGNLTFQSVQSNNYIGSNHVLTNPGAGSTRQQIFTETVGAHGLSFTPSIHSWNLTNGIAAQMPFTYILTTGSGGSAIINYYMSTDSTYIYYNVNTLFIGDASGLTITAPGEFIRYYLLNLRGSQ